MDNSYKKLKASDSFKNLKNYFQPGILYPNYPSGVQHLKKTNLILRKLDMCLPNKGINQERENYDIRSWECKFKDRQKEFPG